MKPIKLITIYTNQKNSEFYFESQKVAETPKGFVPESPKPLTIQELRIFRQALDGAEVAVKIKQDSFFNILFVNMHDLVNSGINKESLKMVWFSPKRKQLLFFSKGMSIKNDLYHLPKLVWSYVRGSLHVFAVFDEEITENTELYLSPFMNVNHLGSVCLGSTQISLKGTDTIELAKNKIMNGFFKSQFTHFSQKKHKKDPQLIYESMKSKFPTKSMFHKTNLKVKDICHIK